MSDLRLTATVRWQPRSDLGQFIASRVTPAAVAGVTAWGNAVLERAQQIVPVATGELKDSGRVVVVITDKSVRARVQFDSPHAAFVEFGTGRRGSASAGAGPYGYSEQWAGMAAIPYLRPATDEVKPETLELFRREVSLAIR